MPRNSFEAPSSNSSQELGEVPSFDANDRTGELKQHEIEQRVEIMFRDSDLAVHALFMKMLA